MRRVKHIEFELPQLAQLLIFDYSLQNFKKLFHFFSRNLGQIKRNETVLVEDKNTPELQNNLQKARSTSSITNDLSAFKVRSYEMFRVRSSLFKTVDYSTNGCTVYQF